MLYKINEQQNQCFVLHYYHVVTNTNIGCYSTKTYNFHIVTVYMFDQKLLKMMYTCIQKTFGV